MDETPKSKCYEMVECLFVEEKKEVYNSRGLPSSFIYVVPAVGQDPGRRETALACNINYSLARTPTSAQK